LVSTIINVKRLSFIKYYCKFIKYDNFSSQQSLVNWLLDALSIVCQQEIINFKVLQRARATSARALNVSNQSLHQRLYITILETIGRVPQADVASRCWMMFVTQADVDRTNH